MSSSCPPPPDSAGCMGRLGVGEAVVAVTPVLCVTALAALERPLPGILVAFAAAAGALLMPGRLGCLLGAGSGNSR